MRSKSYAELKKMMICALAVITACAFMFLCSVNVYANEDEPGEPPVIENIESTEPAEPAEPTEPSEPDNPPIVRSTPLGSAVCFGEDSTLAKGYTD